MASAALREELDCSICLNIFTDPVTLRCGHNFCRVCIDRVLDTEDRSGGYSCPECRAEFRKRPALQRNITLCNIVKNFLSTVSRPEKTKFFCTYCVDSSVPAVKSCLHCEASLCEKHLIVHSKGPEHILTEPSTNLENRKCPVHKKILEYYCTEDTACICVSCRLDGDHRGHQVEMLHEASEKKKEKLRNVLQKLITKREKTEERVRSLEERRRKAEEEASAEAERVTALFIDIRRRLDELEKRVLSEISRQEKEVSLSSSALIQQLGIKKDELSRKMRHIEELCNMTDPLTVLQDPDKGDLCVPEEGIGDDDTKGHDGGDGDTKGHDGGDEDTRGLDGDDEDTRGHDGGDEDTRGHKTLDVDVDVITRMFHAGFSDIITDLQTILPVEPKAMRPQPQNVQSPLSNTQDLAVPGTQHGVDDIVARNRGVWEKGGPYGQGPADILLDVNTAGNTIHISHNLKTATWTDNELNRPEIAERFQHHQVMSREGFSSGRHYWDVQISGSVLWMVGMCYHSMDRRGDQSYIGDNNKSWCLCGGQVCDNHYSVIHDGEEIQLPHQISSDRVRICLDYEAGQLSFYELCDPIRHLHTFTATFTEPLHAALGVYDGSINISGGGAAPRSHHRNRNLPRDW